MMYSEKYTNTHIAIIIDVTQREIEFKLFKLKQKTLRVPILILAMHFFVQQNCSRGFLLAAVLFVWQ